MVRTILVNEYTTQLSEPSGEELCLRINLDHVPRASEYSRQFLQIVSQNPPNITHLLIYGSFDDQDTYGFTELFAIILQNCSKLSNVQTLEINSIKLDNHLAGLLFKTVGTLEQRMLLYTLRILHCRMGSQTSLQLVMALKANTNLHSLDISSNNCGDNVFSLLFENMTKFEQNLNSLSFCHNNISDQGVQYISSILSSQKVFIHELYLSHNPKITADGVTALFVCAMRCNRLQTLSLAGCDLAHADWARYLPFIRSLHTLDLSHNLLNDDALIVIGHSLKTNTSITSLNLSHNRFVSYGAHIFESMLTENACLQSISLACNVFRDKNVWKSMALGLSLNRVLISLDISDTGMTEEDLQRFCGIAFMHNTTLQYMNLEDNFLPLAISHMDMIYPDSNVREYLRDTFPNTCGSILPVSETAEVDSVDASLTWVSDLRVKIQASIEVNAIVDVTTGVLRNHADMDTNDNETDDFERKMYCPRVMEQSSYYCSPEKLHGEIVRDMQELYATFYDHLVYICWGRIDFVLGALEIDVHLTYANLRSRVAPLVEEYLSSVTQQDDHGKFTILAASGDVTDHSSYYQNRSVWADVRHVQPAPSVVLRPANWIKLDG